MGENNNRLLDNAIRNCPTWFEYKEAGGLQTTEEHHLFALEIIRYEDDLKVKKVSGWLLKLIYPQAKALGASFIAQRVLILCIAFGSFFSILMFLSVSTLHVFYLYLIPLGLLTIWLGCNFVLALVGHFLGVILIRKECYSCQFAFYIIEHEKTHLKLNSLDEDLVDEETLKHTGKDLFRLILSKPKLCKRCQFGNKKYLEAALRESSSVQ